MSTSTTPVVSPFRVAFGRCVRAVTALAVAWQRRRIVGQLGELDDHMLSDIGITRHDVMSVLAEPLHRDPSELLATRAAESRQGRRAQAFAAQAFMAEPTAAACRPAAARPDPASPPAVEAGGEPTSIADDLRQRLR